MTAAPFLKSSSAAFAGASSSSSPQQDESPSGAGASAGGPHHQQAQQQQAQQPPPPTRARTVARPLANLGNTCYVNAVLQALSHAPELCLAMDVEPHSSNCPVFKSNQAKFRAKQQQQGKQQGTGKRKKSPSSSPDVGAGGGGGGQQHEGRRQGVRKSRRSGRRSPPDQVSGNDLGGGNSGRSTPSSPPDGSLPEYCALCELEYHVRQVHHGGSSSSSSLSSPNLAPGAAFAAAPLAAESFGGSGGGQSPAAIAGTAGGGGGAAAGGSAGPGSGGSSSSKPYAPTSFVNGFIEHVAPWFKLGIQEDSHEFLRLLIDAMQKSSRIARGPPTVKEEDGGDEPTLSPDNPQDDTAAAAAPPTSSANSTGVVSEHDKEYPFSLFRGMVESRVTCESCGACSATLDPIEDIGLEVTPAGDENVSAPAAAPTSSRNNSPAPAMHLADVQAAFARFARAEALDCGYKCESCGKVGRATKQSRLASVPPILTLHLKRFRYNGSDSIDGQAHLQASASSNVPTRTTRSSGRNEVNQLYGDFGISKTGSAKIEGHIKFDPVFDLKPYLTDTLQLERKNLYCRLFAVLVHAGKNSHSGHYVAYVRSLNKNEWFKMDDGRITPATVGEVLGAEAYMLFYRVVNHPIAQELEQKKLKLQEAQLAAASARAELTGKSGEVDTKKKGSASNRKKRPIVSSCEDGADWARSKTRLPPNLLGLVKKVEEIIADDVEWSAEAYQELRDAIRRYEFPSSGGSVTSSEDDELDCYNSSRPQRKGPTTRSRTRALAAQKVYFDEDVQGKTSTKEMRKLLAKLFYFLAERCEGKVTSPIGDDGKDRIVSWLDRHDITTPSMEEDRPATCSDDESEEGKTAKATPSMKSILGAMKDPPSLAASVDIIVEPEAAADVL